MAAPATLRFNGPLKLSNATIIPTNQRELLDQPGSWAVDREKSKQGLVNLPFDVLQVMRESYLLHAEPTVNIGPHDGGSPTSRSHADADSSPSMSQQSDSDSSPRTSQQSDAVSWAPTERPDLDQSAKSRHSSLPLTKAKTCSSPAPAMTLLRVENKANMAAPALVSFVSQCPEYQSSSGVDKSQITTVEQEARNQPRQSEELKKSSPFRSLLDDGTGTPFRSSNNILSSPSEMEVSVPSASLRVDASFLSLPPLPASQSTQNIIPCTYLDDTPSAGPMAKRRPMKRLRNDVYSSASSLMPCWPRMNGNCLPTKKADLPSKGRKQQNIGSSGSVVLGTDSTPDELVEHVEGDEPTQATNSNSDLISRLKLCMDSSHKALKRKLSELESGLADRFEIEELKRPAGSQEECGLFETFKKAYPQYAGSLSDFLQSCICLEYLHRECMIPGFLYDDYVRAFLDGYLPYCEGLCSDETPMALNEWYNKTVERPQFLKAVMSRSNILPVLDHYAAETQLTRRSLKIHVVEDEWPASSGPLESQQSLVSSSRMNLLRIATSHSPNKGNFDRDNINPEQLPLGPPAPTSNPLASSLHENRQAPIVQPVQSPLKTARLAVDGVRAAPSPRSLPPSSLKSFLLADRREKRHPNARGPANQTIVQPYGLPSPSRPFSSSATEPASRRGQTGARRKSAWAVWLENRLKPPQ